MRPLRVQLAAAAFAALVLTGCDRPVQHKPHKPLQLVVVATHHFKDGRYAYQDTSGVWWWFIYSENSSPIPPRESREYYDTSSGPQRGGWGLGGAPSAADLSTAEDRTVAVSETESGIPMTEDEAQAEADGAPNAPSSAGGDSVSVAGPSAGQPSVPAETQSSPPGESAPSSGESGASSGGDSGGGGGGDGGGGDG